MRRVDALGDGALELRDVRALGEPVAAEDLVDRLDVGVVDRLASVRDRHGRQASGRSTPFHGDLRVSIMAAA